MRILLTNDDGIEAGGIKALIKELIKTGELTVIAPDKQRSAVSHSITFFEPLRLDRVNSKSKCEMYIANGTPADCIFLGIKYIMKDRLPDLVISGINHGANIGDDINYSGTVAGAREGVIHGIPSIAVSLCRFGPDGNFTFAAKFIKKLIKTLDIKKLTQRTLLNINIPDLSEKEIKGISLTCQSISTYKTWIEETVDPRGRKMFWINSEPPSGNTDRDTDYRAISEKKISITPIRLDLTDHKFLKENGKLWKNI